MTGDGNVVQTTYQQVILPSPDSVDIAAELRAIREVLVGLDTPDRRKIENAFSDVDDELAKPDPDRDEVGGTMDRALRYASRRRISPKRPRSWRRTSRMPPPSSARTGTSFWRWLA